MHRQREYVPKDLSLYESCRHSSLCAREAFRPIRLVFVRDYRRATYVSKVFTFLRNQLNAKEKELLELQRTEPCLLAPDSQQIETLLNVISSLHLSTQDGSFLVPSTSNSNDSSYSSTSTCSTGIESIKTLPAAMWLSESNSAKEEKKQTNEYRLPLVTHLLSLLVSAYVASSSKPSPLPSFDTNDQSSNRLPMVNQLFSMPINAFVSSSSSSNSLLLPSVDTNDDQPANRLPMVNQLFSLPINAFVSSSSNNEPKSVEIEDKKETEVNNINSNKISSKTEEPKGILTTEKIYSKEHSLQKCSTSESDDFVPLDLDTYIEQSSEKMRRLYLEYIEAIDKLKTPTDPKDSSQTLSSMYPVMFDRIKQDMSPKDLTRLLPTKK